MNNATLMYIINNNDEIKKLKLESESLFYVDRYTSSYKNEEDFINHYYNKDKIYNFIKENGNIPGKLVVNYAKNMKEREDISPLFNSSEKFEFKDDPYEGKVTEIEKARKLLFNSKNQMFVKLILSSKILDKELNKMIDLNYEEVEYVNQYGLKTSYINNKHYISFKSLFEYRIRAPKLGCVRNAYQDMLKTLKSRLMILDYNTFYFYNRQLRIMINKYNSLIGELTIRNLKIKKIKYNLKYMVNRSNLKHL